MDFSALARGGTSEKSNSLSSRGGGSHEPPPPSSGHNVIDQSSPRRVARPHVATILTSITIPLLLFIMAQINSLDSKIETRIQNVTETINKHDDAMETRIRNVDDAMETRTNNLLLLIANVPNREPGPSPPAESVGEEQALSGGG